jgi:predicted molibdopterin-dependent oxidoreductase YjgC
MGAHPTNSQLVRVTGRDRRTVSFMIDGVPVEGLAGDTVLTAILTQSSRLRKFEFGDGYRAGFCLMGACQDCWVEVDGQRLRACSTLVADGMAISTETGAHA